MADDTVVPVDETASMMARPSPVRGRDERAQTVSNSGLRGPRHLMMRVVRSRIFLLVGGVVLLGAPCLISRALGGAQDMAAGVTPDAIRAVRLDMTEHELYDAIGLPLSREDEPGPVRRSVLEYTRRVLGARWYPMLWVQLEEGRVVSVYGKRYVRWGTDDMGVYMFHGGKPIGAEHLEMTFGKSAPGLRCQHWLWCGSACGKSAP
jgi:hypothetical protein